MVLKTFLISKNAIASILFCLTSVSFICCDGKKENPKDEWQTLFNGKTSTDGRQKYTITK